MTAMPAGDKSFFASFFSKKEDSSFLKKRSKKLLFMATSPPGLQLRQLALGLGKSPRG
jgi:hypothetical protein